MSSAGIGRLLTASLHQAISERLPVRVPFYEPWLSTDGFRTSRVSLAGIRAAFSFLRQEPDAYEDVMRRAGEIAATLVWHDLSPLRRAWLRALPRRLRQRAAGRLTRRLAADTWRETRITTRWRHGEGAVTIDPSLFCDVRGAVAEPLCQYYAAALAHFLRLLSFDAGVDVRCCRARDGAPCVLAVTAWPPAEAAGSGSAAAALAAALVLTGGAVDAAPPQPAAPPAAHERVLVVPFDNLSRDARLTWLTEGAALRVTEALREQGIDALTRDERLRLFERLQVPPLAALTRATIIRLGSLMGATDVITGDLQRDGEAFVIRARRIRLDPGVLDPDLVERTDAAGLMGAFRRIGQRLGRAAAASGGESDPAAPPLAAFEAYVKGLIADSLDTQARFLQTAIRAFPSYDAARLALWQVYSAAGNHRAAADTARAVPARSPQWPAARFCLSLSLIHQGQVAGAAEVLKALQDKSPSPVALNNLGVAVLREPTLAAGAGHPAWYFAQARALDGLDPDYLFNLGYAYWADGDADGASYWLRECVRLDPTDAAAHALLAQALHAAGRPAEAGRELSLARRLSSTFDDLELVSGSPVPRGLERLKDDWDPWHARRVDTALEMVGQRDQAAMARFYLDRGRRLVGDDHDRDAEAELRRALYLAPYDAEAHLLLGRIYLRTGRVREAIDAVKISLWSHETAVGHLVLAEASLAAGDRATARAEAERALILDPDSLSARRLLDQIVK